MCSSWLSFTPYLLCLELQVHLCTLGNCCQGANLAICSICHNISSLQIHHLSMLYMFEGEISLSDGILTEVEFVPAVVNFSIFMSLWDSKMFCKSMTMCDILLIQAKIKSRNHCCIQVFWGDGIISSHLSCSWSLFLWTKVNPLLIIFYNKVMIMFVGY
jgi:hypothetical protein